MTRATSLGFDVIDFADWIRDRIEELAVERDEPDLLELAPRLMEWQRWLLIHALELLPGPELIFRFRTVLLLVARQNGKTALLVYLILWRMFQDGARTVLGTAQSLDIAEEAWQKAVEIAEAVPELAEEISKVKEGKGSQLLQLDGGERYKIASANRRGGRGLSGDLVIFDELREHQSWASWSAASKTTRAKMRAQVWGVSNAGDVASIVLAHLREVALGQMRGDDVELVEELAGIDMDATQIGIFEWSAYGEDDEPLGVWDRDGWAMANPAMGVLISEAVIASEVRTDPEWEIRTEVLCQFVNTVGAGPFPNGSWAATSVPKVVRDTERPFTYCVDLSHDRTMAYVAVAFWDTEGRRRVELAAQRAGVDWLIPWFKSPDRRVTPEHLTMQTRGAPISSMVKSFEDAGFTVTEWGGTDLSGWTGQFYDGIRKANADDDEGGAEIVLTHNVWPALDIAANSAAIKPLGDGWTVDRKNSPHDAAPLMAVIGAHGLLMTNPEPQRESAYEDGDLLVV